MAKPILVITIQSGESKQSATAIQRIVKKTVDNEKNIHLSDFTDLVFVIVQ